MKRGRRRAANGDYFVCRHCGADVPADAPACRGCGSDDETRWAEGGDGWEAGIGTGYGEEEDFDYGEYVEGGYPGHSPAGLGKTLARWGLIALVVALIVAMMGF